MNTPVRRVAGRGGAQQFAGAVGVLALLTGALAGCGGKDEPAAAASTPAQSSASVTPSAPPSPTPSNAASPPDTPEPATAPPPKTAGPLGPDNVPAAAQLGKGWKTYDDPGGAEAGFKGNGAWTRRRDPHQAAFEALPVGCANRLPDVDLPIPAYALQATYRNPKNGPAQILVLRFGDERHAVAYFTGYQKRMKSCGRSGNLTVTPVWSAASSASAVRKYTDQTYTEVSVQKASTVALLVTATSTVDRPWTHRTATLLATTASR